MPKTLILEARERDTIIAALRFWQRKGDPNGPEMEIAENSGRPLGPEEIDRLIEDRINV